MENKRLFITLIAGLLLLTVAIGAGTWAWFTSEAKIEGDDYHTAIVKLEDADGEYGVWIFDKIEDNVAIQQGLEGLVDGTNSPWANLASYVNYDMWNDYANINYGTRFAYTPGTTTAGVDGIGWWDLQDWGGAPGNGYPVYGYMGLFKAAQPARYADWYADGNAYNLGVVDAIFDAIVNAYLVPADPLKVTPGSIIYGDFQLINNSNVPTYFRVERAAIKNLDDIAIWGIDVKGIGGYDFELMEINGYWYSPQPIDPGDTIDLTIGLYVCGAANDNDKQDKELKIGDLKVELIQADNNAPVLAGWDPPFNFYK